MRARLDSWTAFLAMLFLVVGLCGLFASYAGVVPLERAGARTALIDRVAQSGADRTMIETLAPQLGSLAPLLLDEQTPLQERLARARALVAEEARREAASVSYRVRLMLGVVTVLAALLGCAILTQLRKD